MPVNATFGTVEYRENGVVAVPMTFGENVVAGKSIVEIARVSGDTLTGLEYRLVGSGTDFSVIISVPPDRSGRFSLNLAGSVFKRTDSVYDQVSATAVKNVDYSTVLPRIVDYDIPANYIAGENFDVIFQYNTPSTVSPEPPGGTFLDHFIFEGAHLGTPNLYRKTDDTYPQLPIPATLPAEWVQTDMTTQPATIYLLRWSPVIGNPQGNINITPKPGFVRGPTR